MDTKAATQILKAFQQAEAEAQSYLHDKKAIARILQEATRKGKHSYEFLFECWESLQILLRIVRARREGKYSAPVPAISMAVAAILYFINPIDLIPDSIPVLGFVDDAAVISWVASANRNVISNFRQWEFYFGRKVTPYWKRSPA